MGRVLRGTLLIAVGLAVASPAAAEVAPQKPPAVEVHLQHFPSGGQTGAYTPDGRFLLWGAAYGGSITLWNTVTGELVRSFTGNGGSEIEAIAVSADGQYFVAGTDGGPASVFRIATGERVTVIPGTEGSVNAVAYSIDGRYVAAGDDDGHLRVLDMKSGETAAHEEDLFGYVALGFDADSGDLVAVTTAGDVERFRPDDLSLTDKEAATPGTIAAAAFLPATSKVLVGVYDGPIITWDYARQAQVASFAGPSMKNLWFALAPDGSQLVTPADTADEDQDGAILWDVAKGTEVKRLDTALYHPLVSLDGAGLLYAGSNGIGIQSLANGKQIASYVVPTAATVTDISTDGSIAYVAGDKGHALLATATGETVDPAGIAAADHVKVVEVKDGVVNVSDAVTGTVVGSTKLKWAPDYPTRARSADAAIEVVTKGEHTTVIPVDAPEKAYDVPGLSDVDALAIARNAKFVATSIIGNDNHVEIHSLPGGKLLRRLPMTGIAAMAFSPDDTQLLAADLNGNLILYKVANGARIVSHQQPWLPQDVGFSEDGRYFYESCLNGMTLLFDHQTGKNVMTFTAESAAEFVRFLPDRRTMLLGYDDGVKFVDLASGALLAERVFYVDGSSRMVTPEGFYDGVPKPKTVRLVRGLDVFAVDAADAALGRPDLVAAKLAGDPEGIVAQAAADLDLVSLLENVAPIGGAAAAMAIPN
ncbi:MAG TPA: WD40 repeat domain-containing protein, partial [Bauldia sp.]|nr:WD40 repeat domain-containing protein [Bauldia sp.]